MTTLLRVALCQLDLVVGDLWGNVAAMAEAYAEAEAGGADVALFPELAICGYPPEDLVLKPGFLEDGHQALLELASKVDGRCVAVVGWVEGRRHAGADPHDSTDGPWDAAAVLHGGTVVGSYRKQALPNYGVFDEKRYFDPGPSDQALYRVGGVPVAVTVCEDVWVRGGPAVRAAAAGAALVLSINASPFHASKQVVREAMLTERAAESATPIAYLNLVGGQDDLVFDGGSVVIQPDGTVLARLDRFAESIVLVDVPVDPVDPVVSEPGLPGLPVIDVTGPLSGAAGASHRAGDRLRPGSGRGVGGAGSRRAGLRHQEWILGRGAGAFGRGRLGARRRPGR